MRDDVTRRDFMQGVAAGIGAALLPDAVSALEPVATPADPAAYPPALTGMRGSHDGSFQAAHALRDGERWDRSDAATESAEQYDLIVVGAGISGLAAAFFFREAKGSGARILILDNHDDFGGHARRNEFHLNGRMLLGYGGTQNLEGVSTYSKESRALLAKLGVEVQRFDTYFDQGFNAAHGLQDAAFFDRATFGTDRLVPGALGFGFVAEANSPGKWREFLARTPMAPAAQRDILRLQTQLKDYLPGLTRAEKIERLRKMSLAAFLKDVVHVHPHVLRYYQTITHGGTGAGIDAIDALSGLMRVCGALYDTMDLPLPFPKEGLAEPYIYHFPDGNASVARLLVRSLVPGSAPGHTMEDIVTARLDYSRLDRPEAPVRLRLNSTAVRVRNLSAGVEVTYVQRGGAVRVRAKNCVLASWNMMIPYMCPEMPQAQREGLAYCVKAPLVYASVLIRNWKALAALHAGSCYCPGSYFTEVNMDFPVSIGSYRFTKSPEEPCVLHMMRAPAYPGLSLKDQYRAGRAELYATSFEVFERNIRDQLGRMYGPGGFDAGRDIAAITVNRWPHGYAYMGSPLWDPDWSPGQEPFVKARQPFGRITVANADSGGLAETNVAIDQAHRAVQEILAMRSEAA